MGLESMGGLAAHIILSKLGPREAASVACLGRSFRVWASDDSLWAQFCSDDLNLTSPLDPEGKPAPSFKAAYQAWREAFSLYPWSLVMRAKRCWSKLKDWLAVNFPEVLPTLRKGASEDEISDFEKYLKIRLPLPTRVLYRFCDGQELPNEELSGSLPSSLLGVIGGYAFLQSLGECVLVTPEWSTFRWHEESFTGGEMLPCVPDALIRSVHDPTGSQQQDAMLLWLEEHGRRLEGGIIKVRQEGKFRSINLFPEQPPICSCVITNGVKVRASAAFVPEFSNLQDELTNFLFAYSIRISLSPDGCVINGITFSSCQLYWRHWLIRANDAIVNDVNGEAVVGKFPLLRPGEEEYIYESCTLLPASQGSIEGYFTFVPGRLVDARGSPFAVQVACFPLQLPDYIF